MAAFAETNRSPFDLPEAESELTGGYHTEYSSMKFAMFFMAEYGNMINVGCVATLLFLGGWTSPFGDLMRLRRTPRSNALDAHLLVRPQSFLFLCLYVWVRGTLPRFRYDQLMNFGWRYPASARHPQHCGNKPLACLSLTEASGQCGCPRTSFAFGDRGNEFRLGTTPSNEPHEAHLQSGRIFLKRRCT